MLEAYSLNGFFCFKVNTDFCSGSTSYITAIQGA